MRKDIYFLDLPEIGSIPHAYKNNCAELMTACGHNLGNFAFREAITGLVEMDSAIVGDYSILRPILDNNVNNSSVVIACANWVGVSDQYEDANRSRSSVLERIQCPIIPFGLGAQSDISGSIISLGFYTERLVKIISERCKSISVRDEYTADVLSSHGVNNTIITGCPSNLINLNPALGKLLEKKASDMLAYSSWKQIRMHVSEHAWGHSYSSSVLRSTLKLLAQTSSFYILQTPELIPYLLRESLHLPTAFQEQARGLWGPTNEITVILRQALLHFSSINAWMDFARTCDAAVGMRVHGNILPMQAGVPALLVYHDSRTYGLGRTLGIPMVSPEEFVDLVDDHPQRFFEKILSGLDRFDNTRNFLGERMKEHILLNDLVARERFLEFLSI